MSINQLPSACQHLFQAKTARGLTFEDIATKLGKDEVWVGALFYGQAKADKDDLAKLAKILNLEVSAVSSLAHEFPMRGYVVTLLLSFRGCCARAKGGEAD